MVSNEILGGYPKIHWIPVFELTAKLQKLIFRDRAALRKWTPLKYVVPHFISHVLDFNTKRTDSLPIEDSSLKQMCNCVVSHVNGRIREGLDHPLLVPG